MRFRKKTGKSYLSVGGRKNVLVSPGDVIDVEAHVIPEAIRDTFEPLDPLPPPPEELSPPPEAQLYLKRRMGRKGQAVRYDVVNPVTGLAINKHPLSLEDAQGLAGAGANEEPEGADA